MTAAEETIEGFKETEAGLIPIEWESSELSAVATQRKETIFPEGNGKTKYVGLEHIDSGEINLHRHGYDTEVRSGKFRFYTGDILYGKLRPYLDKCVLADFEGICSTDIITVKALDGANNQYLANLMHLKSFLEYAKRTTTGVNHPRTSWNALCRFHIPLPSLPEQQKIASVLSAVQEAKEKTENVISALKELKKSMMKHLFTYGAVPIKEAERVPLKETEIGMIPEEWEVVKLGDITNIKTSFPSFNQISDLDTKDTTHEKILALKVSDMNASGNERYISEAAISFRYSGALLNKYLKPYSVVFPKRGGAIGTNKKRMTTCYSILDPNLIALEPSDKVHADYLFAFFDRFDLKSIQQNTPIPQLNKNDVERILFPYPSFKEQQQIAETLLGIDKMLEAESRKRNTLDTLFKTLLSLLMTGRIRVKDLEIPA